jgi:copper oxidase (laccase) domain-containing protein
VILRHQPPRGFFASSIAVGVSSKQEGNQGFRIKGSREESPSQDGVIVGNRRRFLGKLGLQLERCALVYLQYGPELTYADYSVVDADLIGKGMSVPGTGEYHDALATDKAGVGLFLPLADCYGAAIVDEEHPAIMASHLGRHSTNVNGARKSVEFMQATYGSRPEKLKVWLTPGVGKDSYPMDIHPGSGHHNFATDERWQRPGMSYIRGDKIYLNLRAFNIAGFIDAGVLPENIAWAGVDTATHPSYPSHSRGADWRFALAMAIKHV